MAVVLEPMILISDFFIQWVSLFQQHHKKETFYDEYKRLLVENDIEFDEKYLL